MNDSEDNLPDLIDRASSFIDRRLVQNICDRKYLRIRKVEQALEDISNGLFGTCERCGEDININPLESKPGGWPSHRVQNRDGDQGAVNGQIKSPIPALSANGALLHNPVCHHEA